MDKARIQAWAGLLVLIALPVLYMGGVNENSALMLVGLVLFGVGVLTTPALRIVAPERAEGAEVSAPAAQGERPLTE